MICINLLEGKKSLRSCNRPYQVLCKPFPQPNQRPEFPQKNFRLLKFQPSSSRLKPLVTNSEQNNSLQSKPENSGKLSPAVWDRILGKAPLRLVVRREEIESGIWLEVLECGHERQTFACLDSYWDEGAHLIQPPQPVAKRRRCQECKRSEAAGNSLPIEETRKLQVAWRIDFVKEETKALPRRHEADDRYSAAGTDKHEGRDSGEVYRPTNSERRDDLPNNKKRPWLSATKDCSPLDAGKTVPAKYEPSAEGVASRRGKPEHVEQAQDATGAHIGVWPKQGNTPETSGTPGKKPSTSVTTLQFKLYRDAAKKVRRSA